MRAKLAEVRSITPRDTIYTFECPAIASAARPGQFAEIRLTDGQTPFLRRPISIFDADGGSRLSFLVRTVGRGTAYMTTWVPGTEVDILGPLGRGFSWGADDRSCLLAAGGIGLAPLNFLADRLLDEGRRVGLLFSPRRDSALLAALSRRDEMEIFFSENRAELPVVLDGLLAQADRVFACGPEGMLETVAGRAADRSVPCEISTERHMACGIGICMGCAIAVYTDNGVTYKKVCQDGPVFSAEEVAFHEKP